MYDKNFVKKRFFIKYNKLIDRDLAKSDINLYKKKLNFVYNLTDKIDFNKNILVVYKKDIAKELFLSGFSRLDKYMTYCYYNIHEILDIYFGTRTTYRNETEEETLNSNLEIMQDVLCMTINYYESFHGKLEEVAVHTIMNRALGRHNSLNSRDKLNWVFCLGEESYLIKQYPNLRKIFLEEGRPNFAYYDLNKQKEQIILYDINNDGFSGDGLDEMY